MEEVLVVRVGLRGPVVDVDTVALVEMERLVSLHLMMWMMRMV